MKGEDMEPFAKALYRKLKQFVLVLTYQVLSNAKIAFTGPIFMIQTQYLNSIKMWDGS